MATGSGYLHADCSMEHTHSRQTPDSYRKLQVVLHSHQIIIQVAGSDQILCKRRNKVIIQE